MQMREKIARALATADGKDPDAPAWARITPGKTYAEGICWRDQYAQKADAVLEAMRTPTEEMIEAVARAFDYTLDYPQTDSWKTMEAEARKAITAMIDAARTKETV